MVVKSKGKISSKLPFGIGHLSLIFAEDLAPDDIIEIYAFIELERRFGETGKFSKDIQTPSDEIKRRVRDVSNG
jgi:hypothetical protein